MNVNLQIENVLKLSGKNNMNKNTIKKTSKFLIEMLIIKKINGFKI